jgi:hypothetical protein
MSHRRRLSSAAARRRGRGGSGARPQGTGAPNPRRGEPLILLSLSIIVSPSPSSLFPPHQDMWHPPRSARLRHQIRTNGAGKYQNFWSSPSPARLMELSIVPALFLSPRRAFRSRPGGWRGGRCSGFPDTSPVGTRRTGSGWPPSSPPQPAIGFSSY